MQWYTRVAHLLESLKDSDGIKKITDALPTGNNLLGKVGIDQTTPGTTNKVVAEISGSGVAVTATQTRPNNVTGYTALDVVGTDPATNLTFATGLEAGSGFAIFGARLRIDAAAIPAGMTSFILHLYTVEPTPIVDNAAYNLPAADREKYLDYIEISGIKRLGDTLFASVNNLNITGKLANGAASLYGILQTTGAYPPIALTVKTVKLIMAEL